MGYAPAEHKIEKDRSSESKHQVEPEAVLLDGVRGDHYRAM